jgi:hypothetical protein
MGWPDLIFGLVVTALIILIVGRFTEPRDDHGSDG